MSHDLELRAFFAGIKPALRIWIRSGEVSSIEAKLAKAAIARTERGSELFLYAARDEGSARALRDAELSILPGSTGAPRPDAHRELGRLLGYPRCCVDAYVDRVMRGVDVRRDGTRARERLVAAEDARDRSHVSLGRLNFMTPDRLVPFDPCAFDCAIALRYADAVFALAPDAALRAHLCQPVTIDGAVFAFDRF